MNCQRMTFALPIEPARHAELTVMWPMTAAQWAQMMTVIEAMRPALVREIPPNDREIPPGEDEYRPTA